MATPRRPAATASTAVAKTTKTQVALPAEIEAQIQADIERFKSKLSTPSGNRIAVTQAKQFKMPNGDSAPSITGIITSRMIRFGWMLSTRLSASAPPLTVTIS